MRYRWTVHKRYTLHGSVLEALISVPGLLNQKTSLQRVSSFFYDVPVTLAKQHISDHAVARSCRS